MPRPAPASRLPLEVVIVCRAELLLLGLERLLSREPDLTVFTYSRVPVASETPLGGEMERWRGSVGPRVAVVSDRRATDVVGDVERVLETVADAAVVLTGGADVGSLVACMGAGARCFAMEGDPPDVLVRAVRTASRGEAYVSPRLIDLLVSWLGQTERPEKARASRERDRDLLRLLAEGRSTSDIATRLGIAPKTVRNRLSALYRRLGVRSRAAAVRLAEERGLLDPADRGRRSE
jgi:DNA-binding NarL/FixJ family response regulator